MRGRACRHSSSASDSDGGPLIGLAIGIVAAIAIAAHPPAVATPTPKEQRCGTKRLHGERLSIWVVGEPLRCSRVRDIIAGPCEIGRPWTCIALRHPRPILAWVRWREVAKERPSTAIEGRRPAQDCAELSIGRPDWLARGVLRGHPTRRQLLADDLIRCNVLIGLKKTRVRALLGRPVADARLSDDWHIGDDRRLVKIDREYLRVRYRDGSAAVARVVSG